VTSTLQKLFPAVVNSEFVPETINDVNFETGINLDWSSNYLAVSQQMDKAIISASTEKEK
jgi:hypothetical protein